MILQSKLSLNSTQVQQKLQGLCLLRSAGQPGVLVRQHGPSRREEGGRGGVLQGLSWRLQLQMRRAVEDERLRKR